MADDLTREVEGLRRADVEAWARAAGRHPALGWEPRVVERLARSWLALERLAAARGETIRRLNAEREANVVRAALGASAGEGADWIRREEAARLVRSTPLAPDTHTGTRQRWVLESAARRIEGREPEPWGEGAPREDAGAWCTKHGSALTTCVDCSVERRALAGLAAAERRGMERAARLLDERAQEWGRTGSTGAYIADVKRAAAEIRALAAEGAGK